MEARIASAGTRRGLAVLWLIDSLTMGGAESLTAVFARAAGRDGRLRPHVAFLKRLGGNAVEPILRDAGIPCTYLRARNLRDAGALLRLVRLIRNIRPDVVHAHLTDASIVGAVACRLTRTPFVCTLHVPPVQEGGWTRERIRQSVMCALLRRQGTTVAVSHAQRSAYLDRRLLDPERTIVIHNGIEVERYPARERSRTNAAITIATVAVLRDASKGIDVLLDAIPRITRAVSTPVSVLIVGDGPVRASLEADGRRRGLGGVVRWLGQRDDVPALLAASDIFVLPTRRDQFPTVLLEAMAAGLPVVSTTVDGVPEIVQQGHTGLLVPPGDPDALAAALTTLVSDRRERERLGHAGRERALTRFSDARWVAELYDAYAAAQGHAVRLGDAAVAKGAS